MLRHSSHRKASPANQAKTRTQPKTKIHRRAVTSTVLAVVAALALAACAGGGQASGPSAGSDSSSPDNSDQQDITVRLGFFPNITHAPALVAIGDGHFDYYLGGSTLETQAFFGGPPALEALLAGAIDATFIGVGPVITTFVSTHGEGVRIVAGGASGGAQLVVRDSITSMDQLVDVTLATPQMGGTQDVAAKWFLEEAGIDWSTMPGSDVTVSNIDNPQTLQLFMQGSIDGGWLPEPWASRLVLEAGAHVLVDESDLWPNGEFSTTILVVRPDFLEQHPDAVEALIRGLDSAIASIHEDTAAAADTSNQLIAQSAGAPLSDEVMERAFANMTFGLDPFAHTIQINADRAVAVGTAHPAPLDGIVDLRILNAIRVEQGLETFSAAGLGEE